VAKAKILTGGVTLLYGPPNTGKSHTLRATYATLAPLDPVARTRLAKHAVSLALDLSRPVADEHGVVRMLWALASVAGSRPGTYVKVSDQDFALVAFSESAPGVGVASLTEFSYVEVDLIEKSLAKELEREVAQVSPPGDWSSSVGAFGDAGRGRPPQLLGPAVRGILSKLGEEGEPLERSRSGRDERAGVEISERGQMEYLDVEDKLCLTRSLTVRVAARGESQPGEVAKSLLRIADSEKSPFARLTSMIAEASKLGPAGPWLNAYLDFAEQGSFYDWAAAWLADAVADAAADAYKAVAHVRAVALVPHGRSQLVKFAEWLWHEPPLSRASRMSLSWLEGDAATLSYLELLRRGARALSEGWFNRDVMGLFRPALAGELAFDRDTETLVYSPGETGRWLPVRLSSPTVAEIAGMALPAVALQDRSLLLVENPESGLHPATQVLVALALAGLPAVAGHEVVATTHSDVVMATLALLADGRPSEGDLERLIRSVAKVAGAGVPDEHIRLLASASSRAADAGIKFYRYTPSGGSVSVSEESPGDVLRDAGGVSEAYDLVASWAVRLLGGREDDADASTSRERRRLKGS